MKRGRRGVGQWLGQGGMRAQVGSSLEKTATDRCMAEITNQILQVWITNSRWFIANEWDMKFVGGGGKGGRINKRVKESILCKRVI